MTNENFQQMILLKLSTYNNMIYLKNINHYC